MAGFTRHLQPAKATVAVLSLLGLALSPGSTLELHRGPSSPSMQQTLMMYPSANEPLVFAEETPGGSDDEKTPLIPQGEEGEEPEQPEAPLSPQEEGQGEQEPETPLSPEEQRLLEKEHARETSRGRRFKRRLRKAALYIPTKLRKFYAKAKGGMRGLLERIRAHFRRRTEEKPKEEDPVVLKWLRKLEEDEKPKPKPRPKWRSKSFRLPPSEAPLEPRRRTASMGGGGPRDISSPWPRPQRPRAASLGAPPPLGGLLGERRRAASVGSGLPEDLSSPWSTGTEEGKGQGPVEEGMGEGEQPLSPSSRSTEAEDEGAGGEPSGAMRGGGERKPRQGVKEFPLRVTPLESPLAGEMPKGEFRELLDKAHYYPFLMKALFLVQDIDTARRLAALLPANRMYPVISVKTLMSKPPAVRLDGGVAIGLERVYQADQTTSATFTMLSREELLQVVEPPQMQLLDDMMKELAAAIRKLDQATTFWQAKAIFSQMKVDFPQLARKLKKFLPFLAHEFSRAQLCTLKEAQELQKLMDIAKALIEEQTSTPLSNTYIYKTLIPSLKLLEGRAACDWIQMSTWAELFGSLENVIESRKRSWDQDRWIQAILEAIWGYRSPASVADKAKREACDYYKLRQEMQDIENPPWFIRLPHFTKRTVIID
ncbi:hypothetical protein Emag_006715 [Eimeria magna]